MQLDRDRGMLLFLSVLPLIIGSVLAASVLRTQLIGRIITSGRAFTIGEIVVQALVSTILGVLIVFSLFWVMRRGHHARRLAMAFIVSPILYLVSMFIGQVLLLLLFKGSTDMFQSLLLIGSLGVSMLSIVLIVIDALSPRVRNLFVMLYGSIFGTFLGIITITSSMLVLVLTLVVEDYLLTKHSPVPETAVIVDRIGRDPFDYTRIQSESVVVGVGDFVTFSLIAAHTLIYFPIHVWAMTVLLASVGMIVNMVFLARENEVLPAITLPAFLAVFPWIVHSITLALIVA